MLRGMWAYHACASVVEVRPPAEQEVDANELLTVALSVSRLSWGEPIGGKG